jgi:hypothetical protein
MSRSKKTVQVGMIKDYANEQLANPNNTMEEKLGIITMIEKVLHMANAYEGYRYLELVNGEAPLLGTDEWVSRKYY